MKRDEKLMAAVSAGIGVAAMGCVAWSWNVGTLLLGVGLLGVAGAIIVEGRK